MTEEPAPRIFITDTCLWIHDPKCVDHLGEHTVILPTWVLEELDRLKKHSRVAYRAREASRTIFYYAQRGNLWEGIPTRSGATLWMLHDVDKNISPISGMDPTVDNKILALAKAWKETNRKRKAIVKIRTADRNVFIKGNALDIPVELCDSNLEIVHRIAVSEDCMVDLHQFGQIPVDRFGDVVRSEGLIPNQRLYLKSKGCVALAAYSAGKQRIRLLPEEELRHFLGEKRIPRAQAKPAKRMRRTFPATKRVQFYKPRKRQKALIA